MAGCGFGEQASGGAEGCQAHLTQEQVGIGAEALPPPNRALCGVWIHACKDAAMPCMDTAMLCKDTAMLCKKTAMLCKDTATCMQPNNKAGSWRSHESLVKSEITDCPFAAACS